MTMLFHRTEQPRVVNDEDVPQLIAQGWADSPAAFYEVEKPIVTPREPPRTSRRER